MALVGGGTTPVVWTRAVNMWFDRSRGLALGLTLAGSGLAGIFGPVLCTALIQSYGWQAGYLGIGAFIVVVAIPIVALLFKERATPIVAGQTSRGAGEQAPGLSFAEGIRTVVFWKIAGGFFLMSGALAGLIINIVPLLMDRGLTPTEAAGVAGTLGIAVLVGRIGVGLLLDRFPAPVVAALLFTITAVGCVLLTVTGAPTWMLFFSVISLGFATAAEVDLVAFLVSRYFGMKAYGQLYGSQLTSFYLGAAIGPLLIGAIYDHFGNYIVVLYGVALILVFGATVLGTLGRPRTIVNATASPMPA
jgi:MFS family permease